MEVFRETWEGLRKGMGWDEKTGKPLPETLEKLGLADLVKEL